ncbi:MAG: calcium-binding protein, partial [Polaromonas sp.]
ALYDSLLAQTRLKRYLDSIELVIDVTGVKFDFTALSGLLDTRYQANAKETIIDLAEFLKIQGSTMLSLGWKGATDKLRGWIEANPADASVQAALRELNVKYLGGDSRGTSKADVLLGKATGDQLSAGDGDDILDGGGGDDVLYAGNGNDTLLGGTGSDYLRGQAGNDVLDGGAGNDVVQGGTGSDVYLFGRGDGQDLLRNQQADYTYNGLYVETDAGSTTDVLRFKAGVSASDLEIVRSGNDLVLKIKGTSDQVTLEGFYYGNVINHSISVDRIEFADGSVLSDAEITAAVNVPAATVTTMNGTSGGDSLTGTSGNEIIYGQAGNDVLDGGAGDDLLQGGTGSDTYLFGRGDGRDVVRNSPGAAPQYVYDGYYTYGYTRESDAGSTTDTLKFKAGITAADLKLSRNGAHLIIGIRDTSDQVTVEGFFGYNNVNHTYGVARIEFADGTTLSDADVRAALLVGTALDDVISGLDSGDVTLAGAGDDAVYAAGGNDTISGEAGSDQLYGEAGNDVLDGGAGDDLLQGGTGSDTYLFGRGDGRDVVRNSPGAAPQYVYDGYYTYGYTRESDAGSTTDTLKFKAGITAADLKLSRNGAHLIIGIRDTSDQVTVEGFFGYNNVNHTYGVARIEFADGTTLSDAVLRQMLFTGGQDNDTLYGLASSDRLDGAEGEDVLIGDLGDDTYVIRRGSGQDRIVESAVGGGNDIVEFEAGIAPSDIVAYRNGEDITLALSNGPETVTIASFYSTAAGSTGAVESVKFADGTVWNRADILAHVQALNPDGSLNLLGGAGPDKIQGASTNDTLRGGAGNDIIIAGAGNDRLVGGLDNDTLTGGTGSDTYVLQSGDGRDMIDNAATDAATTTDTIEFLDINRADVRFVQREGNDLTIHYAESDSVTVTGWFSGNRVDQVQFADGTRMTASEIELGFPIQLSDFGDT